MAADMVLGYGRSLRTLPPSTLNHYKLTCCTMSARLLSFSDGRVSNLVTRHGEAIAKNMFDDKLRTDPNYTGKWLMKHPDQPELKDSTYI